MSTMPIPDFDAALIERYDRSGPRYTSYPTAAQFRPDFGETQYREFAARSNLSARPLSLYFHLPFCARLCFYCGCNKIVTKNRARAAPYLERLHREIALQGALFDRTRRVEQLHWGGGTPTFISHDEMRELMRVTRAHFNLRDDDGGEYGIELDPREVGPGTLALLRELGFNRASLGVQDLDPDVQRAVNRIQSEEQTVAVVEEARALGFRSISLDLIYGLPRQSLASFDRTLERVLALRPDRLSIYNYAHLPQLFKPQRRIDAAALPAPRVKLAILGLAIERLTATGYVYIGMDHFALPTDELAAAQRDGGLHRNFQGYSTHADCDLVSLGVTAIGALGSSHSQNHHDLETYNAALDAGRLPIARGLAPDADDQLRRAVIEQLICYLQLDFTEFGNQHALDFRRYFARELAALAPMEQDGLLEVDDDGIQVRAKGHLLIRNICMVWDRYLPRTDAVYSRAI
ncbi:MAG TPA: oxygen-independent coproporphyrinogen III oxidase [Burkholderiales bacterium]|nr:oxygen-independent coproporphyrinogen III oxidase [Burkholderiales bacterium]